MTEERKRKRLILLAVAVAIVLIAGIGIGVYGFSVADNAGQPDAPAEQPGKSAGETKPVTPPAAKSRVMGAPEKNQDGASGGEVAEEASSPNTTNSPGTTNIPNATNTPDTTNSESTGNTGNTGNVGSGEPSTGSGPDSGGNAKAPDPNAGKTWHEAWSEWIVDVPGHYEQQLVSTAWDEEAGHYGSVCNDCGAEVSGNYLGHAKATGHNNGYATHWFIDGTIHHDAVYEDVWIAEQGHSVWHEGYWE